MAPTTRRSRRSRRSRGRRTPMRRYRRNAVRRRSSTPNITPIQRTGINYSIPTPTHEYSMSQSAYLYNLPQYSPSSPAGPPLTLDDLTTYGPPINEGSPTGVADLDMSGR